MHRTIFPAAVAVAVVLAGCGDAAAGDEGFVVRDSAGIEIVDNHGSQWRTGDEWRLSAEPILTIGEIDGPDEYQLFRVSGALRLADGSVVVGNGGTSQLRYFARDGRFIRAVGRSGEGPGEFAALGWMQRFRADSVAVYDFQAMRATVFGPTGELGRMLTFSIPGLQGVPVVVGAVGGRLLLTGGAGPFGGPSSDGGRRDSLLVLLHDPDHTATDTVARVLGTSWHALSGGQTGMAISVPFAASPRFAVGDDRFFLGVNETYDIGEYDLDGRLRRRIRRDVPLRSVTDADIAAHKEQRLSGMSDPQRRQMMDRLLSTAPYPSTFPAFQDLLVDTERNLWVREYSTSMSDPQDWTVFDAEGRMLGSVRIPERTTIRQVGSDFVLLGERDELDVEYVRMYRLIKP